MIEVTNICTLCTVLQGMMLCRMFDDDFSYHFNSKQECKPFAHAMNQVNTGFPDKARLTGI
jgi:hypothetical protein